MELSKKVCVKELRQMGVLSYADFEQLVEKYEPYSDKVSDSDLIAYLISRAKVEILSQVFVKLENPLELKEFIKSNIKTNLENIDIVKSKMDTILRS